MHVPLPDGSAVNSPTAPPAPTSPPTSAPASPAPRSPSTVDGGGARPRAAARPTAPTVAIVTDRSDGVARADPPRHRARARRRGAGALSRARRSRSARRSRTASTTTSSSPRASRSPRTTSRAHRGQDGASTSRPTSPSRARTSPPAEALERFPREDQPYKVELIEDLVANQGVETVSLYTNGPFTDLCRGPHAPSTKRIKAFKLPQHRRRLLARRRRTARCSPASTGRRSTPRRTSRQHLERLEQARARDHRKLGPRARACSCSPRSRPGSPFWLPKGTRVWNDADAALRAR